MKSGKKSLKLKERNVKIPKREKKVTISFVIITDIVNFIFSTKFH